MCHGAWQPALVCERKFTILRSFTILIHLRFSQVTSISHVSYLPFTAPAFAKPIVPLLAKKYEFLSRTGEGAYGSVWRARDKNTGTHVAVKKMKDVPTTEEVRGLKSS